MVTKATRDVVDLATRPVLSIDIDGGSIDGTAVGSTTPDVGFFTNGQVANLDVTSTADFTGAVVTGLTAAAVAASDVTFTPTGTIASTNVQAAVAEVATDVRPITTGGTGATSAITARANLGIVSASETAAGIVERATDAEVTTGTDTGRFMSVKQIVDLVAGSTSAVPAASETVAGIVERATDAEVTTGTDTTRFMSVKQIVDLVNAVSVTVPAASQTVPGIIEIATQAEVNAGTDNTLAVTPFRLTNFIGDSLMDAQGTPILYNEGGGLTAGYTVPAGGPYVVTNGTYEGTSTRTFPGGITSEGTSGNPNIGTFAGILETGDTFSMTSGFGDIATLTLIAYPIK